MKIRYIEPIGHSLYVDAVAERLEAIRRPDVAIEVVSLDNPYCRHHLEYQSYEVLVMADIARVVRDAGRQGMDAVIIGCFYDPALIEAREISGATPVIAPCQASVLLASQLADRFSIIIGRRKWENRIKARLRDYGQLDRLASFRSVNLGVEDFQADRAETEHRLITAARRAVEEDGAEAIILGCTLEFGFYETLQAKVGVPVIDPVYAAYKLAETMADVKCRFGWKPSRVGGCEAPPEEQEIIPWQVFNDTRPPILGRAFIPAYSRSLGLEKVESTVGTAYNRPISKKVDIFDLQTSGTT